MKEWVGINNEEIKKSNEEAASPEDQEYTNAGNSLKEEYWDDSFLEKNNDKLKENDLFELKNIILKWWDDSLEALNIYKERLIKNNNEKISDMDNEEDKGEQSESTWKTFIDLMIDKTSKVDINALLKIIDEWNFTEKQLSTIIKKSTNKDISIYILDNREISIKTLKRASVSWKYDEVKIKAFNKWFNDFTEKDLNFIKKYNKIDEITNKIK